MTRPRQNRLAALALPFTMTLVACGRLSFDGVDTRDAIAPGCDACLSGQVCRSSGQCVIAILDDPALVAYWSLDEPVGAREFVDSGPNGNHGVCSTCPTTGVEGVAGAAVQFANANDPIFVGTGPSLVELRQSLTLSAWVKLRSYTQYGEIISNDRDCSNCGVSSGFSLWGSFYMNGPAFQLRDGTDIANIITAPALPLEEWHFITGAFDGSIMRLFVDGQLVDSRTGALAAPPSFETRLGALGSFPGFGIDGTVDEVMILRRALDASEIAALYSYYVGLPGGP